MVKNKILFLLAVTFLLKESSYGTLYPDSEAGNNITQDKVSSHLSSTTVISVNGDRYGVIEENTNINIENNQTSGKKILNINTTSDKETINKGSLKVIAGTNGVDIVAIQKGNFINSGTLEVVGNNNKGMNITGANIEATNSGNIVVNSGAVGVSLTNSTSIFKNNVDGNIEISGSGTKGIYIGAGKVENDGTIKINNKAIGINLNNVASIFENDRNGNIEISESGTTGAAIWQGRLSNSGNIAVQNSATGVDVNGNEASFENVNEGTIKVDGSNSKGIQLRNSGKATNDSKIQIINNGIGVYYSGEGEFINKENGSIISSGSGSKGIYLNAAGTATNKGNIIVGQDYENSSKQIISGAGAEGINVNKEGVTFTNEGNILVTGINSKGISMAAGEVLNNGVISINNASSGVYLKGGVFTNSENGKIFVEGKDSKGIHLVGGKIVNSNIFQITTGGMGVYYGGSGNFINNGNIYSSGIDGTTSSKGIYLNAAGTATNKGNIIVGQDYENSSKQVISGAGAEGVNVNQEGAIFTNEGSVLVTGINSKGISMASGEALNNGIININSASSGTYLKGGVFTNSENGKIFVEGKDSKGIYLAGGVSENNGDIDIRDSGIGVFFTNNGTFTNENTGSINIFGANSKGIYINGGDGIAKNNGNLNLYGESVAIYNKEGNVINNGNITGNGIGIKLENGYLINEGKIDVTGNAIESIKNSNNTVFLKNGSEIKGKIVGGDGIDILTINGEHDSLEVTKYEAIVIKNEDSKIKNSTIALEYNSGTKQYLEESKNKIESLENSKLRSSTSSGNLIIENSNLIINTKDSLTNKNIENPIIDTQNINFEGDISFVLNSSDGRNEFSLKEVLGLKDESILNLDKANLKTTAVWSYKKNENGDLIAKKKTYESIVNREEIKEFSTLFEKNRSDMSGDFFEEVVGNLDRLETIENFTNAMSQMSGAIHGYTVDISAINSRNIVNTMRNRAMTRDYLVSRPINSWTQDILYLNNNARLDGIFHGNYDEKGVLGISEKQVYQNAKLGFVYGGSNGKLDFNENGDITSKNAYLGGYYNYSFNNNLSLNSNFTFAYGYNKVNRKIDIGEYRTTLLSHYPTYGFGIGANIAYTIEDNKQNRALFYAGIDINRIMQGNINENDNIKVDTVDSTLMIKNAGANEFSYYSITPSLGFMYQNTGYIFDKKYTIGADFNYETEIGNIKDGKRMYIQGIKDQYKVGTLERENIFSTSIYGNLELNESLGINARYTTSISDEYDADMITLGMTYKMDTLTDNYITGPILAGIENNRILSDRWTGTFQFMFENEDDSDRSYYDVETYELMSGDYATSMKMKPKFVLNVRDKKTKWSYYFEGYYMSNDFLKETRHNEREQKYTRLHAEARWSDTYLKGRYGIHLGYRNETASKPVLSTYPSPQRVKEGTHQLRLTPNFTYNLGYGFNLDMKSTSILEYNYTGLREGQTDFLMENEYYLVYSGFMPGWTLRLGYYREDRWMDHDNKKLNWDKTLKEVTEIPDTKRYHLSELRPSASYYFGNGDSLTLSLRIPVGNGAWYNSLDNDKKSSESYETRYSVDYNHVVAPGFNVFGGITFLNLKVKNKDHSSSNYGKTTRWYSFRPKLGISYNF